MRVSLFAVVAAFFVAFNLTGCVPPPPATPSYSGGSYYSKGYSDGCWSRKYVGTRKNSYLYNNYYSYRSGWSKGYLNCRPSYTKSYYSRGYSDGCWSRRYVGTRKNSYLYNRYYTYRNGWSKGYLNCRPYRY